DAAGGAGAGEHASRRLAERALNMADLELRQEGEVVWATMNRPDRLNALSRNLVTELRGFFVDLYWRRDVRVVVLQGAGSAFCAGLDLKERGDPQGSRSV